jgi:hypothetical protein
LLFGLLFGPSCGFFNLIAIALLIVLDNKFLTVREHIIYF